MPFSARVALVVIAAAAAFPARANVTLRQAENAADAAHERLPDLNVVRGSTPKQVPLVVDAGSNEAWTIESSAPWLTLNRSAGTGPSIVLARFDGAALAQLDDPTARVTLAGAENAGTNRATLDVALSIWPKRTSALDAAALRTIVADPRTWPSDLAYGTSWELWGFLPNNAPVDAWERTPCPAGQPGPGCVTDGQAGLAAGVAADEGWLLSTGDPRVVIAVVDTGVFWDDPELTEKTALNARELEACPPPTAARGTPNPAQTFDVNRDGVFNIRDYDDAPWLADINHNGRRDPQDLLYADNGESLCSDGVDDDDDGYTDNIAGWDFFWNDNDPSDDTNDGRGTASAVRAAGSAHDARGGLGVCPRCQVLHVRVGDGARVDPNQLADGVLFSVESGASVAVTTTVTWGHNAYAHAAIEHAFRNRVPFVASMGEVQGTQREFPAADAHALPVGAITSSAGADFPNATTFLAPAQRSATGALLALTAPAPNGADEATSVVAGQLGLIASSFLERRDASSGSDAEALAAPLTAGELWQLAIGTADDVRLPRSESDGSDASVRTATGTRAGWDSTFGFGRVNVRKSLEAVDALRIPPALEMQAPAAFDVVDPVRTPKLAIAATAVSSRATGLRWELFAAPGIEGGALAKVAEGNVDGDTIRAEIDLAESGPLGDVVKRAQRSIDAASVDDGVYASFELRVVGNGAGGQVSAVARRTITLRRDQTWQRHFPVALGASAEGPPKVADLDSDGVDDIVVATSDGRLHAINGNGDELPGFPVRVGTYDGLHREAKAFRDGSIDRELPGPSVVASVALGDLDGNHLPGLDVVVATLDGAVHVIDDRGEPRPGFPVFVDAARLDDVKHATCADATQRGCRSNLHVGERGIVGAPVLVDLDRDDDLEIVAVGLDQQAYAWDLDGRPVVGWPVPLVNSAVDGAGTRIDDRALATPAIADLFGDGTPIVVVVSGERVAQAGAGFVYALWPDGTAHAGGAFVPGWPAQVEAALDDVTVPFFRRGSPKSPAVADLDGDGKDEVVVGGFGGPLVVLGLDPSAPQHVLTRDSATFGGAADFAEPKGALPGLGSPSIADLDRDGKLDIIDVVASPAFVPDERPALRQGPARDDVRSGIGVWTSDGAAFAGAFPRALGGFLPGTNVVVADVDGDAQHELVFSDAQGVVRAIKASGEEATGFPKLTGQWHAASVAVGDVDGDQLMEVVTTTREGQLFAWRTQSPVGAPAGEEKPTIRWASFHHDDRNTGNVRSPVHQYTELRLPEGSCACGAAPGTSRDTTPFAGVVALALLGLLARLAPRGASSRAVAQGGCRPRRKQ